MNINKKKIAGIIYDNVTLNGALAKCEDFLKSCKCNMIVTPNAEIAYEAMVHEEMRTLVNSAEMVIPDGAGVILGAKILRNPLIGKVAGADLAQALISIMENRGDRLYLLGGKPGVADLAAQKLLEKHPKLVIAGTHDGYFKDDAEIAGLIAQSGAAVVFVCLGFPKQERFIAAYKDRLNVRIAIGLGGTMDVLAGISKRAPKTFQKLHLEFLYRLMKEPSRFGRMLRIPKFLWHVIILRFKGKQND